MSNIDVFVSQLDYLRPETIGLTTGSLDRLIARARDLNRDVRDLVSSVRRITYAGRRLLPQERARIASTLGVDVKRVRIIIVVFATVGTAAAVAVSGLIGFVGIIVPHAVRLAIGSSYRIVLPLSLLAGAGFLVFADVIARTIVSPAELPIGVITAFFGAPFFAVVLRTSKSFT